MEVELLKKYGSVSPGKIENLDGTTETVDFRFSTAIRFYHNMEDADFPLHWHAPGEIISPIEGTYTVTIAGKTVTLQPHDVLIIASGELHSIRAPKTGERYIMNYSVSYFHQIQDMAELFNIVKDRKPEQNLPHGRDRDDRVEQRFDGSERG